MKRKEVKVKYNPRTVVNYLKRKRKPLFTIFDLREQFKEDLSVTAWILHDLFILGVLESEHKDIAYVNNIPYRGFRFSGSRLLDPLPEEREATFIRWG